MVKPGRYKHYKGSTYKVLFVARDTETQGPMVIYMNEDHGTYYARPLQDFIAKIGEVPRFKLLDQANEEKEES